MNRVPIRFSLLTLVTALGLGSPLMALQEPSTNASIQVVRDLVEENLQKFWETPEYRDMRQEVALNTSGMDYYGDRLGWQVQSKVARPNTALLLPQLQVILDVALSQYPGLGKNAEISVVLKQEPKPPVLQSKQRNVDASTAANCCMGSWLCCARPVCVPNCHSFWSRCRRYRTRCCEVFACMVPSNSYCTASSLWTPPMTSGHKGSLSFRNWADSGITSERSVDSAANPANVHAISFDAVAQIASKVIQGLDIPTEAITPREAAGKAEAQLVSQQSQRDRVPNLGMALQSYGQGYHLFWAGNYQAALAQFSLAVELYPEDARFWYFKGLSQNAIGDGERAEVSLAHGVALQREGKPREAVVAHAMNRVQGRFRTELEKARLLAAVKSLNAPRRSSKDITDRVAIHP